MMVFGDVPERSKGADCKSVCQRFESARRLFFHLQSIGSGGRLGRVARHLIANQATAVRLR